MKTPKHFTDRKTFLKSTAGIGATGLLLSLVPAPVLANSPLVQSLNAEKGPILLSEPYLQYLGQSSLTVMWIANLPFYSWVEYGQNNSLGHKVHSITDGLVVS